MERTDAERELAGKYPLGATVTYMDPRDDQGGEELVLLTGVINGDPIIQPVQRQVLDSEGRVTGLEPYDLGYVPVYATDDSIRYVAVPNIVEVR